MSNRANFHTPGRHTEAAGGARDARTLILCLDTATEKRSVAVFRGPEQLALRARDLRADGASGVLRDVDEALRAAGVPLREVELFAACTGPGSFTGLRSGLATVKALSKTLRRPAVGVPTLHAVASHAGPSERLFALLPAGRGEVFAQMLRVTREGSIEELEPPAHVAPAALLERAAAVARNGLRWAGSGSVMLAEMIRARALAEGIELDERGEGGASGWTLAATPRTVADHVAALALEAFRQGRVVAAEELRAVYVRPSDAEMKEQCRLPADTAR